MNNATRGRAAWRAQRRRLFWVAYVLYGVLVLALNVNALANPPTGEDSLWYVIFAGLVLFPGMILSMLVNMLPGIPEGIPPALNALLTVSGCLGTPLLVARLLRRWRRGAWEKDPDAIRQDAGIGPDWQVIWTGAVAGESLAHLCPGVPASGVTDQTGRVRLRYTATAIPGVEVAKCQRCRIAWVRSVPR